MIDSTPLWLLGVVAVVLWFYWGANALNRLFPTVTEKDSEIVCESREHEG